MARKKKKDPGKVPTVTLGLIAGFVVVILVAIIGLLYPKYRGIENIKADWLAKTIRLEEQKRFYPIYAQACNLANTQFDTSLPLPERKAIPRSKVSGLAWTVKQIAEEQGVVLSENKMDTESFKKTGATLISMNMTYKGAFLNFKPCLVALIKLPCFKHLESVEIRTDVENVRYCSIRFKIAIENNDASINQG